jgi:hypothetical protein
LLLKACPCGHTGLAAAETLPRELTCSACGSSRHVEAKDGKRVMSKAAFAEWLLGSGAAELA